MTTVEYHLPRWLIQRMGFRWDWCAVPNPGGVSCGLPVWMGDARRLDSHRSGAPVTGVGIVLPTTDARWADKEARSWLEACDDVCVVVPAASRSRVIHQAPQGTVMGMLRRHTPFVHADGKNLTGELLHPGGTALLCRGAAAEALRNMCPDLVSIWRNVE